MKKHWFLVISGLLLTAGWLSACDISVLPEKDKVLVGDTLKVLVKVHLTHRKCVLPIDETEVEPTNGVVLSHTPWKKTGRMDRESVYTIVFTKAGRNRILVTRECSREGLSEGKNYVAVTYNRERAIQLARTLLTEIKDGKRIKTNSDRLSDIVKWINSQKKADDKLKSLAELLEGVVESAQKDLNAARRKARAALKSPIFSE